MWQLFWNDYKYCAINVTIMLHLVYNVHTCDHAMCAFPPPNMGYKFSTKFLLWFQFIQLGPPIELLSVQLCCDYCATTYKLIKIQIHM
jgi:hypothetical protein